MDNKFFKEKLTQARMLLGLSLQEIGEKLDVTKQYIQQIENGAKVPSEMFVNALASVLLVTPRFFSHPIQDVPRESECFFRKARTTAQTIKERALQQSALFANLVGFIDDNLDLPYNNFLSTNKYNNEAIESIAEQSRDYWKLGIDTPIKDMSAVLENSGAIITYFNGISEKVDAFSINKKRPIIIRNPEKDTVCRMRFDLAHEFGHIVLHSELEDGASSIDIENQANRFASAFLLPRNAFVREFGFLSRSYRIDWIKLIELKRRWKVSLAAIIYRAYDLGVIDAVKYRNAYIGLRNKGWSKSEPLDNELPMETPTVLSKSLAMLDNNGALGFYLEDRGMSDEFFMRLSGYEVKKNNDKIINIMSLQKH